MRGKTTQTDCRRMKPGLFVPPSGVYLVVVVIYLTYDEHSEKKINLHINQTVNQHWNYQLCRVGPQCPPSSVTNLFSPALYLFSVTTQR